MRVGGILGTLENQLIYF